MNLNLEADLAQQVAGLDPKTWTALQAEFCVNVANAKHDAFAAEAERAAEFVRLGLITRTTAADYLHNAAAYNSLYFEYGADHIQSIISAALASEAA